MGGLGLGPAFVAPPAGRWPGPAATQERRVAAHGTRPHCVASAGPRPSSFSAAAGPVHRPAHTALTPASREWGGGGRATAASAVARPPPAPPPVTPGGGRC